MIHDLSQTLRAVLRQPGLAAPLGTADIVFDHPEETFKPQQTTVDLFLYDIREDLTLRSNEPRVSRHNGKVTTYPPPLRLACSYLVTAWPVGDGELALQEHFLLGQVVQVLSRHATIPAEFLQGTLKAQTPSIPLVTALVDPQKNLSEFWTALGSRMRPSLTVTATIAMDLLMPETATMVKIEDLRLGERTALDETELKPSTVEDLVRIGLGGRIVDAHDKPLSEAAVTIAELGLSTVTDADGRYQLIVNRPGAFTLRASKGGKTVEKRITVQSGEETNLELK